MPVSILIQILLAVMGMFVAVTALLLFKKNSKIVKTIVTVLLVVILILGVVCLGLSVYWCFKVNDYFGQVFIIIENMLICNQGVKTKNA